MDIAGPGRARLIAFRLNHRTILFPKLRHPASGFCRRYRRSNFIIASSPLFGSTIREGRADPRELRIRLGRRNRLAPSHQSARWRSEWGDLVPLQTNAKETQVIIVGGGPTGLALAIELGHRSIACVLIEKNDRTGYAPRAKNANIRTREHLRRWGIADDLAAASPFGTDSPSNILFV